jgi:hypothetical protein
MIPQGYTLSFCNRGGGDLLRQLHELAEAESNLTLHQRRLSEIEAKVELHPLSSRVRRKGVGESHCALRYFFSFVQHVKNFMWHLSEVINMHIDASCACVE